MASAKKADTDFVFLNHNGKPHDQRNIAGRVLKRAIINSGIERPWPTFHDFRETFGSAWDAEGVGSLVELQEHLGHANAATTASRYMHPYRKAERSEQRRERIGEMYGPPVLTDVLTGEGS